VKQRRPSPSRGDGAVAREILAGKEDQQRRGDSAGEIAEVDYCPDAQHLVQSDLAGRPRHDDQCVAGKEFRKVGLTLIKPARLA
jgi:hypothetical protein